MGLKNNKGFIFGFHRATDSLGAVIGPLLALLLMHYLNENMRLTFVIAFIPALIGVVLLVLFVKERSNPPSQESKKNIIHISWREINPHLKLLVVSPQFQICNS